MGVGHYRQQYAQVDPYSSVHHGYARIQPMRPEPRINKPVRMSPNGVKAVQEIADRDGVSWAEAVRRLLKWATSPGQRMPKGWH